MEAGDKVKHTRTGKEYTVKAVWKNRKILLKENPTGWRKIQLYEKVKVKVPEKTLKYEAVITLNQDRGRCGHAHGSRREAGQCARHYANKVKETYPNQKVWGESMTLTSSVARGINLISLKWHVDYTPPSVEENKEPLPQPGTQLEIVKEIVGANIVGHEGKPGNLATLVDIYYRGGCAYKVKLPSGYVGTWSPNCFALPQEKSESKAAIILDDNKNKENELINALKTAIGAVDIDESKVREIARDEAGKLNKFIPKLVSIKTPEKTIEPRDGEIQHPEYERLARWIAGTVTRVWIFGPAGTGKTHGAIQICKGLNYPWYLQPRVADEYQLSGFKDAHGNYHATQIYRWAHDKNPRAVLILDEVDRNLDVVNIWYNAALANGIIVFPDGPVEVDDTKLVIATANTAGHGNSISYSAAQAQDVALLDRFSLKLPWNICEKTELQIALNKYPYDKTEKTVEASIRVRNAITDNGITLEWGPRRTFAACEAVASGEKLKSAFEFAGLNEIEDKNTKKKLLNVV